MNRTRLLWACSLASVLAALLTLIPTTASAQEPAERPAPAEAEPDDQGAMSPHQYLLWFDEMMKRRARHLKRLAEYRDAGQFPINNYEPGRVPVFIDANGTPCAMGYLMLRDGQKDLVDRIVKANNLIRLEELDTASELGREIMAWLTANGLTLADAALVQPSYDWDRPRPEPEPEPEPQPDPIEQELKRVLETLRLKRHFRAVIQKLAGESLDTVLGMLEQRAKAAADSLAADLQVLRMSANPNALPVGLVNESYETKRFEALAIGRDGQAIGLPRVIELAPGATFRAPAQAAALLIVSLRPAETAGTVEK